MFQGIKIEPGVGLRVRVLGLGFGVEVWALGTLVGVGVGVFGLWGRGCEVNTVWINN